MAQGVWRPGNELIWTLVAHNADGILVVGERGRIVFANQAAAELFGKSVEHLLGQSFGYPVVGGDRAEVRIPQGARADASPGASITAEMRVVPIDWEGEFSYLVSLRDITERCDREQTLETRAHELELMNQELEAFCQTVSHDLWGYSRHVEKYSRLILERFSSGIDDEGRSYLQLLNTAGQRMKSLVEDLLQLSRVRYRPFRPSQTNLSQLAHQVVSYLQLTQPQYALTIEIEPDLVDICDAQQMEIVLENLLGNALKYSDPQLKVSGEVAPLPTQDASHRKEPIKDPIKETSNRASEAPSYKMLPGHQSSLPPTSSPQQPDSTQKNAAQAPSPPLVQITMGCLAPGDRPQSPPDSPLLQDHPIYFVQDNGIGFEPQLAPQVFLPFHRLPIHAHIEGNGVGLAIVRRIIRRHGGQIWAHSAPKKGSIFYFTLKT